MLSLLLFSCFRSQDFSLARESNSLSDYWRVRLLSLELRLFLVYFPYSTTLSFRLQFPSFSISFLWIPWVVHSLVSVFCPTLLSGSSGIAVSSSRSMSSVSYFRMRGFQFSFSYAYFVLRCLIFVLPSFIHAESVHEFALLACCYRSV